jgi:hypothetical protein
MTTELQSVNFSKRPVLFVLLCVIFSSHLEITSQIQMIYFFAKLPFKNMSICKVYS